jgi:hypothetical protein
MQSLRWLGEPEVVTVAQYKNKKNDWREQRTFCHANRVAIFDWKITVFLTYLV